MNLFSPSVGLFFWQFIIFLILLLILNNFFWPKIIYFIDKREKIIFEALYNAKKIEKELFNIDLKKKKILNQAIKEKEDIINQAIKMKNMIKNKAKLTAMLEKKQIINDSIKIMDDYKDKTIKDLKKHLLHTSILLTKKILKKHINEKAQNDYIDSILNEI